jgi:hypothetical protein
MGKRNLVRHLNALLPAIIVALLAERALANNSQWRNGAGATGSGLQIRSSPQLDQMEFQQYEPAHRASGRMYVLDKSAGNQVALLPGLLDETLLNRGSFSFGTKLVTFNRLKVLGNIYVKNVNGRPLHESYLFKSRLKPSGSGGGGATAADSKQAKIKQQQQKRQQQQLQQKQLQQREGRQQ